MIRSLPLRTPARTGFRLAISMIVVLSMSACSDSQAEVVGSWQLVSGTQGGAELQIEASNPLTIVFDSERVTGHGGCNSFSGGYTLDGSSLTIGPVASTQMACESLDLETAYLTGLSDIDTASSGGDELTLSGPDTEFLYEAAPTS